jgi:hypothetical protein
MCTIAEQHVDMFCLNCLEKSYSSNNMHQDARSIAFFNHQIALHQAKLVAYERELISLVQAVRPWCPYLLGRSFLMHTDHFSLKFLLD